MYRFDCARQVNFEDLVNQNDDTLQAPAEAVSDQNEMATDGYTERARMVVASNAGVVVLGYERT